MYGWVNRRMIKILHADAYLVGVSPNLQFIIPQGAHRPNVADPLLGNGAGSGQLIHHLLRQGADFAVARETGG